MPKNPNPRRNNWRMVGEHVGRPRAMALVPVLYRDPGCLLHNAGVWDMFPENRPLGDLDFGDLEELCSCRHESHDKGTKAAAIREKKVCPRCRIRRARNGSCFCD